MFHHTCYEYIQRFQHLYNLLKESYCVIKRIILTTTYSLDNIGNIIDSIGIKSQDVILKPFNFSELFSILKEPGMSYNSDYL
jgi:hypothetical protein